MMTLSIPQRLQSLLFKRRRTSATVTTTLIALCQVPLLLTHSYSTPSSISRKYATMSKAERLYEPYRKHPALFGDVFLESWLHPDMLELVKAFEKDTMKNQQQQQGDDTSTTTSTPDTAMMTKISPYLRLESEGVYSFPCLSDSLLQMFNEELQNFYAMSEKYNIPVRRPNSMNNYGVIVNEIGMMPMITSFQQTYLWPIARRLFPQQGSRFDDHHSFIVRYQAGEDLGLDMHTDDSDVTFNVCLGDANFTGATLVFCGMFGQPQHRLQTHVYHHQVGRAVLHLGSRRHGAEDIESGARVNLIVWSHNHLYRRSEEYMTMRQQNVYQKEERAPDPVCLSFTHDRDYTKYKEIPESKKDMHFHPWCPPRGKEYDGYYEEEGTKTTRTQDIQSQDEL